MQTQKSQSILALATEFAKEKDRDRYKCCCSECGQDTEKIRVYPYELYPLGLRGEISAYVCLKCGNW